MCLILNIRMVRVVLRIAHVSLAKEINMQTAIDDYTGKGFKCPIADRTFLNVFEHEKNCIYTYCKMGTLWKWSKGLV